MVGCDDQLLGLHEYIQNVHKKTGVEIQKEKRQKIAIRARQKEFKLPILPSGKQPVPILFQKGSENPASLLEPKNSDESETNSGIVHQTGDFDVGFSSFINHIDALPYLATGANSTGGVKNSHFYPGDNDLVSTHRRWDFARRDKNNFSSSLLCENDSKDAFLVRSDSDNYSCRNSFTESLKFSSKCGLSSRGSSPFEYKPPLFVGDDDDDIPGSVLLNRNELKGLVTSVVRATLDALISDGRVCLSDADVVPSLQNKMEVLEKRFEELSRTILSVNDEVEHRIEWHICINIYYSKDI